MKQEKQLHLSLGMLFHKLTDKTDKFLIYCSKALFSFQPILLNPISHIKFSALCWYSSSIIRSFLCCPLTIQHIFNLKTFPINPISKYLSQVCCSSPHLTSCQYLSANETSGSWVTGDLCLFRIKLNWSLLLSNQHSKFMRNLLSVTTFKSHLALLPSKVSLTRRNLCLRLFFS